MVFDFGQLIAHAAKTRPLGAGTIVGSGTVSNRDASRGSSCIVERRMIETIESGSPVTPFLKYGDRVRIEMLDAAAPPYSARSSRPSRRHRLTSAKAMPKNAVFPPPDFVIDQEWQGYNAEDHRRVARVVRTPGAHLTPPRDARVHGRLG